MSWFEKRAAQAAAARKYVNRARKLKLPGKGNRQDWKREESMEKLKEGAYE
jgi:hypothetical protein